MKKVKLPLSYRMVRGAIGKKFVIKHYRYGIIKTRYPNMTGIKASPAQRVCRNSFREAVAQATKAYRDPEERMMWQKKLRKTTRLFGAMVKVFFSRQVGSGQRQVGEKLMVEGVRLTMDDGYWRQLGIGQWLVGDRCMVKGVRLTRDGGFWRQVGNGQWQLGDRFMVKGVRLTRDGGFWRQVGSGQWQVGERQFLCSFCDP